MTTTLLKKLREEAGLSQGAVAKELSLSRPTYISLEHGKRELTLREASEIARMFNLSLEEIVSGKQRADIDLPEIKTTTPEIDIRISVPQQHIDKFKQVLLYVLGKTAGKPNIGMTALYKLLYFIDFDYYEKYEEQLMGLTYIKNHYGPTPREFVKVVEQMKGNEELEEVVSKHFQYEQKKFLPHKDPDLNKLTARELEMVDSVLARYGDMTATQLTSISHEDTPWAVADDGANIDYEHVFYRPEKLSVREYDPL